MDAGASCFRRKRPEQRFGHVDPVSEERSDLEALAAGTDDAIAQEPAILDIGTACPLGRVGPSTQKSVAACREAEPVVARDVVEGDVLERNDVEVAG
jgi:hypothetical protein